MSTSTFSVKSPFLGHITDVFLSDLRNEEYGYSIGDSPAGWPVQSITVIDATNNQVYTFGIYQNDLDLDKWNCRTAVGCISDGKSLSQCGPDDQGKLICKLSQTVIPNHVKVSVDWRNVPQLGGLKDMRLELLGTRGTSIAYVSNYLCHDYLCSDDANGMTVHWVKAEIGSLLSVRMAPSRPYPVKPDVAQKAVGKYLYPSNNITLRNNFYLGFEILDLSNTYMQRTIISDKHVTNSSYRLQVVVILYTPILNPGEQMATESRCIQSSTGSLQECAKLLFLNSTTNGGILTDGCIITFCHRSNFLCLHWKKELRGAKVDLPYQAVSMAENNPSANSVSCSGVQVCSQVSLFSLKSVILTEYCDFLVRDKVTLWLPKTTKGKPNASTDVGEKDSTCPSQVPVNWTEIPGSKEKPTGQA
ncbi:hypothetical protein PROFUN_06316 [Planoprotostelium fungivorum]|uniref:Uncharacterized protein n=1 Tax=Planoprotostelium fungivorum TaxID=1890364 RepID=A0A2P6NP39_9EUKA|nr:hypothetical protein PROFUN_06316 [Planoprotostelium fungivorum]